MESLANPTLRSVIRPSQDCGLKMVCSSITTPGMKGIQVLPLRRWACQKVPQLYLYRAGRNYAIHGVGKLDWGFGPAGAEPVITGIDVLVIKGDKIGAIYTFLDPPRNSQVRTLSSTYRRQHWITLSVLNHSAHFVPKIAICDKMRFAWPK